jgi:hypothetical protein
MNVAEFVAELKKLDQTLTVVSRGYEGGYCDIDTEFDVKTLWMNIHSQWYYGPHDDEDECKWHGIDPEDPEHPKFDAVVVE